MLATINKWIRRVIGELHFHLRLCSYCHWRKATWWLATGHEVACDECVPRGEDYDEGDSLDDKGRKYPGYKWRSFADQEEP